MPNDNDNDDDRQATPERLAELRAWYAWGQGVGADWVDQVADLLDHIDWLEVEVARLKKEAGA
ncbi:MAG TPA: hypothetical protein VFU85_00890 [Nocardioides sp.]|nr:hypothetical protein [Nocardioides sp.]